MIMKLFDAAILQSGRGGTHQQTGVLFYHMFDEPSENPIERPRNPSEQAREKSDEFRMAAELFAVFEGPRKFDASILPGLDATAARDIQRSIGRLEKAKSPESPVLPAANTSDAAAPL